MTITYGTKTFDVNIDSTSNTLSNIRDAINKASGNTGVQASIINEQNGSRLVLTSSMTGKDNTIKVAAGQRRRRRARAVRVRRRQSVERHAVEGRAGRAHQGRLVMTSTTRATSSARA